VTDTPLRMLVGRCSAAIHELATLARPGHDWLDLDMTMGQLKAMFVLTRKGPQSVGRLGRTLTITEPSASQLVDKLVERGLVLREPDPTDKRRTLVVPTATGEELVANLQQIKHDTLTRWLDQLGDDDLHALLRGLESLLGAARTAEDPRPVERSIV
jgi:DNA-binding MarR family transcriptional regulator